MVVVAAVVDVAAVAPAVHAAIRILEIFVAHRPPDSAADFFNAVDHAMAAATSLDLSELKRSS